LLSVIIATDNSEYSLTPTLAALVAGAAAGHLQSVIIADGGSTDGTPQVADIAGCDLLVETGLLSRRLRLAAQRARSPWLMFLRAGVVLDPSWVDECARFMQQAEVRGFSDTRAATFRKSAEFDVERSMLAEAFALLRLAFTGPGPEQGLLITKRFYEKLGGHRDNAADPEADLIGQLGRRHLVVLRTGAAIVKPYPR
jgi:glycosyltransferase involved in cell wall biosynthesis